MQTVVSVATMRHSDAETIQNGVTSRELMYRAGHGVYAGYPWKGPVAIVCGSGNNGGDGYVLASLLWKNGIPCRLFLLSERFSRDGRYYFDQCVEVGIPYEICGETLCFLDYEEIVDCIFGTGFTGDVKEPVASVINAINQSGKTVISVDINSGLDGDNGLSSLCVKSDLTFSIGFYKSGHFLNDAKDHIGELRNLDIGIDLYGRSYRLVEKGDFAPILRDRLQNSHKGDYGYVSLLGGCASYGGAIKLANLSASALRAGCGVAQLILPSSLAPSVSPYLLESTLCLLPDEEGHMLFCPEVLDRALTRHRALAIGMGWGSSPENERILTHILKHHSLSLVIDADGLNTLAGMDRDILGRTRCRVLLTPHLKEFERLSGFSMEEIRNAPIVCAEQYAKQTGVCLLLKGPCTVVTDGEETLLVDRGCAGMATAGSGDVLSGILAGLLGYSPVSPLTAACGAYLAGLAGEIAQKKRNPISMIASDTVLEIGEAMSLLLEARSSL